MKLYIANKTCSEAVQIVANELGINLDIIHYDVAGKSTTADDNFAAVNPMGYVPALVLDNANHDIITETAVVASYLADLHPQTGLIPPRGTIERVKVDQLLVYIATEIAQKHIPLMRKLLSDDGVVWTRNKLVNAYKLLDDMLADGRPFLTGEKIGVADAYLYATFWQERSGAKIGHLKNVMALKARMDAMPSVVKALKEEAEIVAKHKAEIARRAA